jgi:hypothetical protein
MDFQTLLQQLLQQQPKQGGWPSQPQPQDLSMFMQYLQPQQQPIAKTDSVDQLKANGVQPKQGGLMSKGGGGGGGA